VRRSLTGSEKRTVGSALLATAAGAAPWLLMSVVSLDRSLIAGGGALDAVAPVVLLGSPPLAMVLGVVTVGLGVQAWREARDEERVSMVGLVGGAVGGAALLGAFGTCMLAALMF
jgi:hypothetical protein